MKSKKEQSKDKATPEKLPVENLTMLGNLLTKKKKL
jgi:hypothetical protein